MSSDEEISPSMQFARSVQRLSRRPGRLLASPSDSENSPVVVKAAQQPDSNPKQTAACGYIRQQLVFDSPHGHTKHEGQQPQLPSTAVAPVSSPLREQHTNAVVAAASLAQDSPGSRAWQPQLHDLQPDAGSPSTPAANRAEPLDLHDPYTPWLRTSRKPPLLTPKLNAAADTAAAAAAGAVLLDSSLLNSPASISSASSTSSPSHSTQTVQVNAASEGPSTLQGLCAAIEGLGLAASPADTPEVPSSSQAYVGAPATAANNMQTSRSEVTAAAFPADGIAGSAELQTPIAATPGVLPAAAASAGPTCAADSDDGDDEAGPLTLGRRTQPRVYRRPLLTLDTDSDSSSSSDGGDAAPSPCSSTGAAPVPSSHAGSCKRSHTHKRITPGSTSSLVSRRQRTSSSSSRPTPTDAGYTGAYDFDLHLPAIRPPGWQLQRRQQHLEHASGATGTPFRSRLASSSPRSAGSSSPRSPVTTLCFTPGITSGNAAAAAAAGAVGSCLTPGGGGGQPGAARRLSLSLLGGGLPISPPSLKMQSQSLQVAAATGRRGAQTAQPASRVAARTGGQPGDGQAGKALWPLREVPTGSTANPTALTSSNSGSSSGCGGDRRPGDVTPSRRRQKDLAGDAGARHPSNNSSSSRAKPSATCATAPAKAPSSRTFARQRQVLAQQLYGQWNMQVFGGQLPPGLPLVWNPRLTATAGQVVDDGSSNHLKTSRGQRIPARLELSSKVIDCEARLRTTLSHEMCHVAAWVIDGEWKEHHGKVFWAWAKRFEAAVPGIKITTCHTFEVHAPFRWQCSNDSCGKMYVRHKRSIDTQKHACGLCQARLRYLGKFSRDGKLIASSVAGTAAADSTATPGGGNAFTLYVKTHFAEVKRALPAGTPHKDVMSRLASAYKEQKLSAAAATATESTPQLPRAITVAPAAAVTPEVVIMEAGAAGVVAAAGTAGVVASAASPAGSSGAGEGDGWQTADEEVEEQTSSLLRLIDRLSLC